MKFIIKPIVCYYGVICEETGKTICVCTVKTNADLIADILNADNCAEYSYNYSLYPNAKYKVTKLESEETNETN